MAIQFDGPEAIIIAVASIILAVAQILRTYWNWKMTKKQERTNRLIEDYIQWKKNGK